MSRPSSLLLVRAAPTAATRRARFPLDEPLDVAGRRAAAVLASPVTADLAVRGPAQRCRQTAAAAGRPDARVVTELRAPDHGAWNGRSLAEVAADQPDEFARWRTDPDHPPPGGEPLRQVAARTATALAGLRQPATRTVVVTHGAVIRTAVVAALGAPLGAFWQLDVAPCHLTELHARTGGGWHVVQVNSPPAFAIPTLDPAPERV